MGYKEYSQLKTLILKEIFKNKSTSELSKELGFKFDKCKRWLDNAKILKWDEFILLCEVANLDFELAMSSFNFSEPADKSQNIFSVLKEINAFETNQEIADYLCCHPSVVQRYIIGKTSPDLETVFKLIDKKSNMLASFIYRLFSAHMQESELFKLIEKDVKTPLFEASHYLSSMIQACITIKSYAERTTSSTEWLSEKLGNSKEEISEALEKMLQVGIVKLDGVDNYKVENITTNMGTTTFQDTIPFYTALNTKLIDMLEKKKDDINATSRPGIFGSRVYSASTVAMEKIRTVAFKTNAEILKILEDDDNERVEACCMLLQVFKITNDEQTFY